MQRCYFLIKIDFVNDTVLSDTVCVKPHPVSKLATPVITATLIAIIAHLIGFPPLNILFKTLPEPKFNGYKLIHYFCVIRIIQTHHRCTTELYGSFTLLLVS